MESLRQKLPPTRALVVFEAAARHLSFTRAAQELCLTQAAVSRQIGILERNLGVSLFAREKRSVRLTAEGKRLQAIASPALAQLAETAAALRRSQQDQVVNIRTTTAFGALWLMPRIGRFQTLHPDIRLRLVTSDEPVSLHNESIDLAIVYGHGEWPGFDVTLLFRDELFPVCSPDLALAWGEKLNLEELTSCPLLHLESVESTWVTWREWLGGLNIACQPELPGTRFNNYLVVLEAAQQSRGIALGWSRLVNHLLTNGQLVRPLEESLTPKGAYFLLTRTYTEDTRREIAAVREWLVSDALTAG